MPRQSISTMVVDVSIVVQEGLTAEGGLPTTPKLMVDVGTITPARSVPFLVSAHTTTSTEG